MLTLFMVFVNKKTLIKLRISVLTNNDRLIIARKNPLVLN